ncbi:hypothetical protein LINPERHAP2_LOCUS44743 [Linum perenne]
MGGSRRKLKRSRPKVKVGLPRKNPNIFKPAFNLPPKFRRSLAEAGDDISQWDDKASVIHNYKTFGVLSNPNLLSVRSRTSHILDTPSLQAPPPQSDGPLDEFEPLDSGSDLEEDDLASDAIPLQSFMSFITGTFVCSSGFHHTFDLKSALGKQRRDGKSTPLQPLTNMQRYHISRLVEKYGDDYQKMFMDTKLNRMQHSVATLEKLCKRYQMYKDTNPMLVP